MNVDNYRAAEGYKKQFLKISMPSKCFVESSSYNQPWEPDLDALVAPGPDTFSGHPAKLVWATVFPLFREEPFFGPFEWVLLAEWAVGLLLFSIHIQFNKQLDKPRKDSWRLKIWFFQIFGILAYWYKFIWKIVE